ncbi:Poly(A)+ RNA export protein [Daldinia childiae]|uniref:Poly(A)+ RNA export protein n=1 Tax=Daldinia childiae TaxID=326645 RepID=UPI0014467ACA|nr:Poly(A)+ RNA export protein [Daldinia childiae]KAF3059417.1 Poly(A)+ RNA export protein [Daldinia childiae]
MSSTKKTPTTLSTLSLGSLSNDVSLPDDAQDTISSVSWSPVSNHLAAASWDGKIRVYDVNANNRTANGTAMFNAVGPVLGCDWAKAGVDGVGIDAGNQDGTIIAAGGADKSLHILHLPTGQQATLSSHEKPIRSVRFVEIPESNTHIVASGSWDKTVKLWDLRQQSPVTTIMCEDRVYSMDAKSLLFVVATAERHIHLINLRRPTVISRTLESPLKHQTKVVDVFPDGKGWATASIEGKCSFNAVDKEEDRKINFKFRCHRGPPELKTKITKVWSVNDVRFHPVQHTVLVTAGSDGTFHFWDRIAHARLQAYPSTGSPITTTAFNHDGSLFAYALGYDWSKGCAANSQEIQTKLMLHSVTVEESTPKSK